jgi:hypothetical protein
MGRSARHIAAAITLTLLVGAAPAVAQNAAIALDIADYSGNSQAVLSDIRARVTAIFQHAGVTVDSDGGRRLTVNILSADMESRMGGSGDRMGFTPSARTGHLVYVFGSQVELVAAEYHMDKTALLAAVIAHEVGHVLLPHHAHSPSGLMRANWEALEFVLAANGNLQFAPYQAAELRKLLTR